MNNVAYQRTQKRQERQHHRDKAYVEHAWRSPAFALHHQVGKRKHEQTAQKGNCENTRQGRYDSTHNAIQRCTEREKGEDDILVRAGVLVAN